MHKKLIAQMLIYLFAIFMLETAQAVSTSDSLDHVLANLPDKAKLTKLNKLAYLNIRNSSFKFYTEKLLAEAKLQNNYKYQGNAYFLLMQHYYTKDIDTMRSILKIAEPIFLKEMNLEHLFRAKVWNIYTYAQEGNDEKVFSEAEKVEKLSERLKYPEGKEMVDQAMANYYFLKGLPAQGLRLYEDVFKRMEARNSPLIKRYYIIRQILNQNVSITKRVYYLDKLKGYIDECEKNNISQLDDENPLYYIKYVHLRSSLLIAEARKDPTLMRTLLEEIEFLVKKYHIKNQNSTLTQLRIDYYQLSKQYKKAIALGDQLIKEEKKRQNRLQSILRLIGQQALIYRSIKKYDLAMERYDEYMSLKDSIHKSEYLNELAKMQIRHDDDEKALKIKELQLEMSQNNLWRLGTLLVISLLACAFLSYIIYSRKRRNKLLHKAKERAEESDRMKSAFLSNINHEIRTPLNAIIGFSEVLIDEEDEEQRQQYVNIIKENNGMLQQLIDGILSVSIIESATISFKFTSFSLSEFMEEIRHIAPTKISDAINIEYTQGPNKKIKADRSYLGQALIDLLTFSASRAQKGSIRFGYTIEDDMVSFFVQNTEVEISQEEISLLLDYQLLLQSWTKGVGMGINLEIAATKTLVNRMGGHLELISGNGQGMAIYLTVPFKPHDSE